jgi:thiamine pyrophosphate-dependent acetolactate synthase large subunit-like protein
MASSVVLWSRRIIRPANKEVGLFLNDDAVVGAGGGNTQVWTMLGLRVSKPAHMLPSRPLGCLDDGVSFALAAKLRYPEKQVLTGMGDGRAAGAEA